MELAQFLRQKAEECLRLAHGITGRGESAAAQELVIMAASLHERAMKLETSQPLRPEVKEVLQANDDVGPGPGAGTTAGGE